MRNKLSVVLFTVFLFGMFMSASLVFAADNLHPKTTFSADRAPKFMIPYEKTYGMRPNKVGTLSLGTRLDPPTNSPGERAGLTYYDYQHNGSMGRQVAGNQSNGYIFIVFMAQDDTIIPGDRGIKVQAYDAWGSPPGYLLDAGGYPATDPDYAGYTSCTWGPNNNAAFGCHVDPGTGTYNATYYYDQPPFNFIFYSTALEPDPGADWYQPETIWPIIGSHEGDSSNTTEDVVYMLTHVFNDSEDLILYRKVGSAAWDQGQYIETVTDLSYTIVPDANSDMVAVVYTDDMNELATEGEGGQTDLDVYYMLSTDQGDHWGSPVCVSNYSELDDSLWRAYSDLSAVITPDGFIHIIAPVRELRSQSSYENYKSRLVHWDVELSTGNVSTASVIDEARYVMEVAPNQPCDPDAWNLYIAKPSVSYCDGKLYALYTKFGDDNEPNALNDCSQARFANGELYLAGSDTYLGAALGRTWDTAWNITQTRTPMCDSAQCESDHWSSMGRYGMYYDGVDDTLDIMYINDKDAGGIPQGSGTWCVNNVMHYRFPCRTVAHIPKISLEPTQWLDPTHTAPDAELLLTLKVSNIGNEVMNIASITAVDQGDGTDWINIGSYATTITPNDFTNVAITLNYNTVLSTLGDPAGYDVIIRIDHDAVSDVDDVPVHLTVASDFNMPHNGVLNTTCKSLMVYNTGRLGGDEEGNSLDIPGDCDSVDTPPNELMYLFDASPMIAWNNTTENLAYTTMFTQDFTEDGTFRPQSDTNFYYGLNPLGVGTYDQMTCTVTTSDSLYGIAIDLYAPTDGINCFILASYTFFNWNPVKDADQVYLGFIADWDTPSDNSVDNGSDFDADLQTMWQFGADYDTLGGEDNLANCPSPIIETDRLGGVAVLEGDLLNAWTEENAPYQLGSGYDKEYLYTQMTTLGGYVPYDQPADTGIDLHTGMTFGVVDMTAKAEHKYVVALVTTNQGEADYLAQVAAAKAWGVAQELVVDFVCDCIPGDANDDKSVNVGDAVYVISYVFKGGPAPTPYASCSGDANGDCSCNVGDAVYIISYVFKGGPAPVDCPTWVTGCGTPIYK